MAKEMRITEDERFHPHIELQLFNEFLKRVWPKYLITAIASITDAEDVSSDKRLEELESTKLPVEFVVNMIDQKHFLNFVISDMQVEAHRALKIRYSCS